MKTGGTNLLLLTISAFWSSSRWPRATYMSSRRQISIPLGGRYRQVSLYRYPTNVSRVRSRSRLRGRCKLCDSSHRVLRTVGQTFTSTIPQLLKLKCVWVHWRLRSVCIRRNTEFTGIIVKPQNVDIVNRPFNPMIINIYRIITAYPKKYLHSYPVVAFYCG